jgi:hypothetical protein
MAGPIRKSNRFLVRAQWVTANATKTRVRWFACGGLQQHFAWLSLAHYLLLKRKLPINVVLKLTNYNEPNASPPSFEPPYRVLS